MPSVQERLSAALADRYRVERELGAGGMATVFLAHDLRHDRPVAIKVLRPELAAVIGAERFLAEIKTTANLQHPHILSLHDSGEVDGTVFYVMPYVDGESLRDRLSREKQLPIDDAIRIATEVADALGAAHARGIVHRDIKPENILLQGGHALVADFGIALAASNTGGSRMTETGMSLGTPTYMSPEQAMGERTVDARTDIYALGAVTYEMLTGDPPFTGSTAQAIVAKVLTGEAEPVTRLRRTVPPGVAETVHAALQKLPADRPATAALFAEGLRGNGGTYRTAVGATPAASRRSRATTLALSAALAVTTGLAIWGWSQRSAPDGGVRYHELAVDPNLPFFGGASSTRLSFSSDDRTLAAVVLQGRTPAAWVRDLDDPDGRLLPGGTNANMVAFGPDPRRLAVGQVREGVQSLAIRIFSLDGGPPTVVVDDEVGNEGLAWASDGWIYFDGLTNGGTRGLDRIRDDGSQREAVTQVDTAAGETDHVYPALLPDGKRLLFTVRTKGGPFVAVLDIERREVRRLMPGTSARYLAPGWLLYTAGAEALMGIRFDPRRATVSGRPIAIAETSVPNGDAVEAAISPSGATLFLTGRGRRQGGTPVWVDLSGNATLVDSLIPDSVTSVSISPDGQRLAFGVEQEIRNTQRIVIKDLPAGVPTPLPAPPGISFWPTWAADGRSLYLLADTAGTTTAAELWRVDARGVTPAERVGGPSDLGPFSVWKEWILVTRAPNARAGDIARIASNRGVADTTFPVLFDSRRVDFAPRVSPDGRWLAHLSEGDSPDDAALYVRPFPDVGGSLSLISSGAVLSTALWSPDGRTLYYVDAQQRVVAAALTVTATGLQVTARRPLFDASGYYVTPVLGWDIAPDGRRFLMLRADQAPAQLRLFAIENLATLLERRARAALTP